MKAPLASTENPQVKEKQNPEVSNTAIPNPSPIDDTTTTTQSTPTENANLEEIPATRENNDPTTRERLTEQCLNLIENTKNRSDVSKEHTKQAAESLAVFFNLRMDSNNRKMAVF